MTKPINSGKNWTQSEINKLKKEAKQNLDTEDIAKNHGRTKSSIYSKASEEGISLLPKDKD